jgi:hypothetical protein
MPGLTTVDHANSQAQTAAAYERVTAAAVAELHDAMAAGAAQDGLSIEERIDFAVRSARRASRQRRAQAETELTPEALSARQAALQRRTAAAEAELRSNHLSRASCSGEALLWAVMDVGDCKRLALPKAMERLEECIAQASDEDFKYEAEGIGRPLDRAISDGSARVVELLIEAGSRVTPSNAESCDEEEYSDEEDDEVDEDELIWKFATKADFEEIKVMLRRAYTAQEGAV